MNQPSIDATPDERAARADIAQRSLDRFFGAEPPQFLNNIHPISRPEDNATFNYWWLAHVIDARLDAFERSDDPVWRDRAVATFENILERNGGQLFNDYFDDMLWLALAALRLAESGAGERYATAAEEIWEHVIAHGWNEHLGASLAWRKQQLAYKNTPANGPLVILSLRLHRRSGDSRYLDIAERAMDWLNRNMVDAETGFVEDGINRLDDGAIDTQWRFTYNQGLYLGAHVEFFRTNGDRSHLVAAERTAVTAIEELAEDGVFRDEGEGGDEGLFQGVYFRYLGILLAELMPEEGGSLRAFALGAADRLWQSCALDGSLLASKDWHRAAEPPVHYSTQLSAIMALELAAALTRRG